MEAQKQKLYSLIDNELKKVKPIRHPELFKMMQTESGRLNVANMIFRVCERDGCSVQSAINLISSDME